MKYTDYEKVFELANNLVKDVAAINDLTDDLSQELKKLEDSFLDDGIDEVKEYVSTIKKQINSSQESLSTVAAQLVVFGNLLAQGKG